MNDTRPIRSVSVVGATGLVGSECVRLLIDDPAIERIEVLARRKTPHGHIERVDERIVNFEKPDSWSEILQVDAVVCALGTTIKAAGSREQFRRVDLDMVVDVARCARRNGVACFIVVSSYGANAASRMFYYSVKGEVERALSGLAFDSTYVLRPSMLLGRRRPFRLLEFIGKVAMVLVAPLLSRRLRPLKASTVARFAVDLLHYREKGYHIIESETFRRAEASRPRRDTA